MNDAKIKQHISRLAQGYRLWCIPLIYAMWEVGFGVIGADTVFPVIKNLIIQPHFTAMAVWTVIFSVAMDHWGKLVLNALTDISQPDIIHYMLARHSFFALILTFTPLIYFCTKALWMYYYLGGISISVIADIKGLFSLLAVHDCIKAIQANNSIKTELDI